MREEETSEKEEKTPEDKYEKKYSEVPEKIGKKFDEMEEKENESEDFKAVGDNVIIEPKPITESIKDGVAASVESSCSLTASFISSFNVEIKFSLWNNLKTSNFVNGSETSINCLSIICPVIVCL